MYIAGKEKIEFRLAAVVTVTAYRMNGKSTHSTDSLVDCELLSTKSCQRVDCLERASIRPSLVGANSWYGMSEG